MADVFTPEERSRVMRRVRSRDTGPGLGGRRWLHAQGFRFRLHRAGLPGKPDIVLPRYATAVFVHGCFWHGHAGCKAAVLPASNRDYWERKIGRNVARDRRNLRELRTLGWRALVLWECRIRDEAGIRRALRPLLRAVAGA